MVSLSFKRQLQISQGDYTATVIPGYVTEDATSMYLPLLFDEFAVPDLSITGCTLTAAATKIVGAAGRFDNVRVGDVVVSTSTGTVTSKATVDRACSTFTGLRYVVYPSTNTAANLGVRPGDAVTGTGIPANTVVDKIDHGTRRIFLDKAATAEGSAVTLTFAPVVRVTAVRTATASSNPNEIDIDSTVATAGANSTVVIRAGAREATFGVLKVTPVGSTTRGLVTVNVGVSALPGESVLGTATGFPVGIESFTYTGLGQFTVDGDAFLVDARSPRP